MFRHVPQDWTYSRSFVRQWNLFPRIFRPRSQPSVMQTRPSALLFEGFPRDDLLAVMGRERIQRLVHVSFIRRRRLLASAAREVARSRTLRCTSSYSRNEPCASFNSNSLNVYFTSSRNLKGMNRFRIIFFRYTLANRK